MVLDGLGADAERVADLGVGQPVARPSSGSRARGRSAGRRRWSAPDRCAVAERNCSRTRAATYGLSSSCSLITYSPVADALDQRDQLVLLDVLAAVGRGPGPDRGEELVVALLGGDDDRRQRGVAAAKLGRRRETGRVEQRRADQNHVRQVLVGESVALVGGRGGADRPPCRRRLSRQPARPRRKSGSRSTIRTRIVSLIEHPFNVSSGCGSTDVVIAGARDKPRPSGTPSSLGEAQRRRPARAATLLRIARYRECTWTIWRAQPDESHPGLGKSSGARSAERRCTGRRVGEDDVVHAVESRPVEPARNRAARTAPRAKARRPKARWPIRISSPSSTRITVCSPALPPPRTAWTPISPGPRGAIPFRP